MFREKENLHSKQQYSDNYFNTKYNKYKNKYLQLRKLVGGNKCILTINANIPTKFEDIMEHQITKTFDMTTVESQGVIMILRDYLKQNVDIQIDELPRKQFDKPVLDEIMKLVRTRDVTLNILPKLGSTPEPAKLAVATDTRIEKMPSVYQTSKVATGNVCTISINGFIPETIENIMDSATIKHFNMSNATDSAHAMLILNFFKNNSDIKIDEEHRTPFTSGVYSRIRGLLTQNSIFLNISSKIPQPVAVPALKEEVPEVINVASSKIPAKIPKRIQDEVEYLRDLYRDEYRNFLEQYEAGAIPDLHLAILLRDYDLPPHDDNPNFRELHERVVTANEMYETDPDLFHELRDGQAYSEMPYVINTLVGKYGHHELGR